MQRRRYVPGYHVLYQIFLLQQPRIPYSGFTRPKTISKTQAKQKNLFCQHNPATFAAGPQVNQALILRSPKTKHKIPFRQNKPAVH